MLAEIPQQTARDRSLQLRSLDTFAGLDDEGIAILAEHTRARRFKKDEILFEEGDPIKHVHIVRDGMVRVSLGDKHIADVTTGRGVGFLSVLSGDTRGVHAVATQDTTTLEFSVQTLWDAFEQNFSLTRNSLRLSADSLLDGRHSLPIIPGTEPPVDIGTYREEPFTLVERVLKMRDVPLFAGRNLNAVIDIARAQKEIRLEPGDIAWRIGDPPSFALRIECGAVRCTNAEGESVDIGSDYVVGAMDTFADKPRGYEVEVLHPLVGIKMDQANMLAVMETHFQLAKSFVSFLAQRVLEEKLA